MSGSNIKLLVSISGFNGTVTPSQTIYIYYSNCVIYRTCTTQSIQTSSSSEGVFLYTSVSSSDSVTKSFLHDSSIFNCGELNKGSSIHRFSFGNISYSRNNLTNNKCTDDVGIEIDSYQNCNLSRSTFKDNSAVNKIFYIGASGPYNFYQCNIVRNTVSYNCFRIINSAQIIIESCSFINNQCSQTFDLSSSSCSVTIIQSDYDGQSVSATIKSTKKGHYNNLSHISTGLCHANFTFSDYLNVHNNELNNGVYNDIPTRFNIYGLSNYLDCSHILTKFIVSPN